MIKTKRFILRDYTEKDLEDHVAILDNFEVARWLSSNISIPYTKRDGRKFIASAINDNVHKITNFTLAIEDKATGKHVGGVKFFGLQKETEIGYWIREEFWGQGIGYEVLAAMVKYGFGTGKIEEIVAQTAEDNEASKAILRKAGFKEAGETPKEYVRPSNSPPASEDNSEVNSRSNCSAFFRLSLIKWKKHTQASKKKTIAKKTMAKGK